MTIALDRRLTREVAIAIEALNEGNRSQRTELEGIRAMKKERNFPEVRHLRCGGGCLTTLLPIFTVPIGWSARWALRSDRGDRLDTYLAWRHMRFVRFQVHVRDTIMKGINTALSVAGKQIGFSTKLNLTGVTTIDEIDQLEQRFVFGSVALEDVASLQC